MTAYQQIEAKILPLLTSYQNDVLVHDKKRLENYSGRFIYGCRESGTDILPISDRLKDYLNVKYIIENETKPWYDKQQIANLITLNLEALLPFITQLNKRFFYFNGISLDEISRDKAISLYMANVQRIASKLVNDEQYYFDSIYKK